MEKPDIRNVFDALYKDFCNNLRATGRASTFCELIRNASSDLSRITMLSKDRSIVLSLIKAAKKSLKNKSKDSQQAKKMLENYYARKDLCSENSLILLLNAALTQVQIDHELDIERIVDFENDEVCYLENLLLKTIEKPSTIEETLLGDIHRERANYFLNGEEYVISVLESLRSIYYAKINKNNPSENLFPLLFVLSTSLKHLNQLKAAENVVQFSIKLLRISALDNVGKSRETIKLIKLLKEIHMLSKQGGKEEKTLKLKHLLDPKNENIPKLLQTSGLLVGASDSVELKWRADRGRHVVATKTIPAGSTIIIEHPFSWIIHAKHSFTFCQNCCHEVKNLVPCTGCSAVIFCSRHCQLAYNDYHLYECKFMETLTSSEILGDMGLLCYRSISKMDVRILGSHVREYLMLQEKLIENNSDDNRSFHEKFILGLDDTGPLDSRNYRSVFAQTPNSDARMGGDLLKRCFSAIFLTLCHRLGGYFQTSVDSIDENENLNIIEEHIASLLLRHLQSTSCNAYEINNISGSNPCCLQINEIGGATYPIVSTTNHSCNSNVYRFTIGNTCIVKTLREIHAGEEIFDSYGPHFASNSVEERIRHLNGQHMFSCDCLPCIEDWSVYSKLPKVNPSYKCPRCEGESSSNGKNKHICLKCSNVFDTKKITKIARELEKKFQASKELLLSSKYDGKTIIDYEAVQDTIVQYENVLGKTQKWPSQTLIECQEALKLSWNLQN